MTRPTNAWYDLAKKYPRGVWWRSSLYNLFYALWTAVIGIAWLPVFIFAPDATQQIGRAWSRPLLWAARYWLGIRVEWRGMEFFTHQPVIYAAKHQSALDILALMSILQRPCFVLKRELLFLPIFGQYLWRMGMIAIRRKQKHSALRILQQETRRAIVGQSRPIVIFPEGTRIPPGGLSTYHPGVCMMALHLHTPLHPVALHTGHLWPRNAWVKHAGTAVIEFLPPIPAQGPTKELLASLKHCINEASQRLMLESPPTNHP